MAKLINGTRVCPPDYESVIDWLDDSLLDEWEEGLDIITDIVDGDLYEEQRRETH